jgi:hypothetical protein
MENNTCGIYKALSESLMHALLECSQARHFRSPAKEVLLLKLPRLHPAATWTSHYGDLFYFDFKKQGYTWRGWVQLDLDNRVHL